MFRHNYFNNKPKNEIPDKWKNYMRKKLKLNNTSATEQDIDLILEELWNMYNPKAQKRIRTLSNKNKELINKRKNLKNDNTEIINTEITNAEIINKTDKNIIDNKEVVNANK